MLIKVIFINEIFRVMAKTNISKNIERPYPLKTSFDRKRAKKDGRTTTLEPKNGFRLEDADDISELVCRLMRRSHDLGDQHCQSHFLNPAGSDEVIEFALQD